MIYFSKTVLSCSPAGVRIDIKDFPNEFAIPTTKKVVCVRGTGVIYN
jgi:hypothetical protein